MAISEKPSDIVFLCPMKSFCLFLFFALLNLNLVLAQDKVEIRGMVKDAETNEPLLGAVVLLKDGVGVAADLDGNYVLIASAGSYEIRVSYLGYELQKAKVKVGEKPLTLNFSMRPNKILNEVEIVADVAKARETPVAFSNIDALKLQQELGTRDLPMVLNSTPGVYATESGGGAGDSRINVRGFDQRNVAVMVDGVPFNDMENGAVYWSNWEGLNNVTRTMQVQRGLGASKLAIASVGGTINIITKGIDQKAGGTFLQEFGNNNALRTSISYNSGLLERGWGYTFSFSRRTGNGWVDQTWIDGYSYFFKLQKRYKSHLFTLGVNGAAQSHGQRSAGTNGSNMLGIASYSREYAIRQGINADSLYAANPLIIERGLRYNNQWGYYLDENGNKVVVNERVNYYTKPVFNFAHFYTVNSKLNISNVAYLSIGRGGGAVPVSGATLIQPDGQTNYQDIYDTQRSDKAIKTNYSLTERLSSSYMRASVNNHFWYGLLSTLTYKPNNNLTMMGGVDFRSYDGDHYQTPYSMLGGDYVVDQNDNTRPSGLGNEGFAVKRLGDKVNYYYRGQVRWTGIFSQAEYRKGRFTFFVNLTGSLNYFQRVDFFQRKDLVLPDTTIRKVISYAAPFTYNGNTYTINSAEAQTASTGWKQYLGYTLKGGSNFNIDEHNNVFVNVGYLVLPPRFVNTFDRNNNLFGDVKPQYVSAIELGYGFRDRNFALNYNAYYTIWQNRPPDFTPSKVVPDENGSTRTLYYNINGMDAVHMGNELDFNYKVRNDLTLEGIAAWGDWRYTSSKQYTILDADGQPADSIPGVPYGFQSFDAKGIHVGNAAQIQLGGSIKYEPIKGLYIRPRYTYFAKNYANFDPTTLVGSFKRDSWQMPPYGLVDVSAGYTHKFKKSIGIGLNVSVINVMNTQFISDAQNNINGAGFGAINAGVFMGQGRRYTVGIKVFF